MEINMWEESIRLELLASAVKKAVDAYDKTGDKKAFDEVYRDLRIEFPTLSEREIWQVIGLCGKVRVDKNSKEK